MQRAVAIDYGKARIGLAVESPLHSFAMPHGVISCHRELETTIDRILERLSDIEISYFVVGLPLLLNGKDSPLSVEVREFAAKLSQKAQVPHVFWDERLTSKQVDKFLQSQQIKRKKRDKLSDPLAATLILQSYLDSLPK